MSFVWPVLLLALIAIPVGVAAYRLAERSRRRRAAAFGGLGLDTVASGPHGFRRRLPGALLVAGFAILALALARPQGVISVPRFEGTIVLAFDVSGSMAATDFAPTRMEAAKAAAREFVARQPAGIVLGIVAFSDSGLAVQAPTSDHASILAAIGRLGPERGTSIGQGMLTSLQAIELALNPPDTTIYTSRTPPPTPEPTPVPPGVFAPAAIVMLTDGENTTAPEPLEVAQLAAQRGVRIHAIGIGSPEGVTLEVNEFRVHTSLNEPLLRRIAELTGGTYQAAADAATLEQIYGSLDTRLVVAPETIELTSVALGLGILVLVVGGLTSLRWLGRLP